MHSFFPLSLFLTLATLESLACLRSYELIFFVTGEQRGFSSPQLSRWRALLRTISREQPKREKFWVWWDSDLLFTRAPHGASIWRTQMRTLNFSASPWISQFSLINVDVPKAPHPCAIQKPGLGGLLLNKFVYARLTLLGDMQD